MHSLDNEYGQCDLAVVIFDTEQNGKSFDIVIKDLATSKLGCLLLNSDGVVAFDHLAGVYYTQVDAEGRGSRVFRH